ncbi:nitroreductase family deazaflavin-dependent oxidoreductase [Streptomyces phaeoluteigriseus]|uniref:nitroreductase family deazaflavin-dependent oxidoreductase n=1 Tax=Streptomyces phaeoluteigriseus TaxID=114686 RepID=UPI003673DDD9
MTRFRSSRGTPRPHPGVRLVQKVSATPAFARAAPHLVPALDRAVHRLTRGKVLLSARLLPGLVLTATGARSGRARRTPLACMPDEEGRGWMLIGSNFGRPGHPAWTANLLAHPDAEVSFKGVDIPVTARLLTGEERAAAWKAALAFWPPYAAYQARVEREIRLFRLSRREPAAGPAGTPRSPASPPPTSG